MGIINEQNIQILSPKNLLPRQIRMEDKAIINKLIRCGFDKVELVRLSRVRNHFKVLYISDITECNGKRTKTSIFNRIQDFTTKSKYGWRRENLIEKIIQYEKLQ